jgi:ABC-type Fe3+-citrate transport system substrate-binding protein
MNKPYSEMTAAERVADRIAKNREIDRRVNQHQSDVNTPAEIARGQAKGDALTEFHLIKKRRGIDAASDFVHNRAK